MLRRIRIKIDLAKLLDHLAREERRTVSPDEAARWLREAGFAHSKGDYWTVVERDLGQLEPSEVLEVYPVEEDA